MKPTNSPTQGQPNPRNIKLKVAFGHFFRQFFFFRGLGLVLYRKQNTRNPTKFTANTLFFFGWVYLWINSRRRKVNTLEGLFLDRPQLKTPPCPSIENHSPGHNPGSAGEYKENSHSPACSNDIHLMMGTKNKAHLS